MKQHRRLLPLLKKIYTQILIDRHGWDVLNPPQAPHYQRLLPVPLTSDRSKGYSEGDPNGLGACRKRYLFSKMGLH